MSGGAAVDSSSSQHGRSWHETCRPRLTQANPAKSLFGSTLETKDKALEEDIKNLDLDEYAASQASQKKQGRQNGKRLPEMDILDHTRAQLAKQKQQASQAQHKLAAMEEKTRYFSGPSSQSSSQTSEQKDRPNQWISSKDIEKAEDMNTVGLNQAGSYNYDKYGPKQPAHQYSLIGGVLNKGMDFPYQNDPYYGAYPPEAYSGSRACRRRPRQTGEAASQGSKSAPPTTNDLPPNIRHQFGTSVCQAVLADPKKVGATIENQKRLQASLRRTRIVAQPDTSVPADSSDPQYEALGQALRQNVFPGYTYDHKNSITKSIYTSDVHKNRQLDPDEFRYQRDELSTWHEHMALQQRQRQQWQRYQETRPKFQANWDRNAKREPRPEPPRPVKPKPKPRPKKKEQPSDAPVVENDIVFEDIEFKTPPLTPLQKLPPPALATGANNIDDDFWGFYDQPLPLP